MKYLVFLDARSIIGRAYAEGSNEGANELVVLLNCSALDTSHTHYAVAIRTLPKTESSRPDTQTIHIPHTSIAYVVEYAHEAPAPFGFVR